MAKGKSDIGEHGSMAWPGDRMQQMAIAKLSLISPPKRKQNDKENELDTK